MNNEKPKLLLIEKLKLQAENQTNLGGNFLNNQSKLATINCPNCGAGRAKQDGVTKCAYCNHQFISTKLDDGIHLKITDNSGK